MISVTQIKTYNTDGLVKSTTQLSSDKVKNLNLALDKYLEDHKDENKLITGLSVVVELSELNARDKFYFPVDSQIVF